MKDFRSFQSSKRGAAKPMEPVIDPAALTQHVTETVRPALADLRQALSEVEWSKEAISAAFKATLTSHKLKMPHLAMPVRLLVAGTTHTPSRRHRPRRGPPRHCRR